MFTAGCVVRHIPKDWYRETIEFYEEGLASGWANEKQNLPINDEQKDPNNKFGYLLRDLDGDGADELLIGLIDDSEETKFTDIYIWHSDIGSFRIMSAGEGYYMYLCPDNVIREDSWYGSKVGGEDMIKNIWLDGIMGLLTRNGRKTIVKEESGIFAALFSVLKLMLFKQKFSR